ncbi:unnamed protein product, partial [Adineta steineri]
YKRESNFLQVERKFFGNGVPTCTGNIDSSLIIVSTHSISNVIYFGAFNDVDFFNRINLVYGIVTDYCTPESCPTMSGGPR